MKQLLLSAIILLAFQTVNAQYHSEFDTKTFFISAGAELGIPSNTPFNISYGGSVQAELKVVKQVGVTLTGGYNIYNYKRDFFGSTATIQHPALMPLKAGLKYYAGPGFYASGELGTTVNSNDNADKLFVYSLGIGFEIPLNQRNDIDLGFRYESYSERQYAVTGIRVAYRVGW